MACRVIREFWVSGMVLLLVVLGAAAAQGQQNRPVKDTSKSEVEAVDSTGPAVYKPGKRSPFEDPARRPKKFGPPPSVKPFPSAEQRLQEYLVKRNHARAVGARVPSALTAYLVSELEVNGIYKTKEGMGAFVRARTTDTTFFIRAGDKAYNGTVVRIDAKQVVFTDITWMNNGPDQVREVAKAMQAPTAAPKQQPKETAKEAAKEAVAEQKQ